MQDGITLKHHPGRLADAELDFIDGSLVGKLREVSPRYAHWLGSVVETERCRRDAAELADPIEPQMPLLNCARWTDAELAESLVGSYVALETVRGLPAAESLLHRAHFALLGWAKARFGQRQKDQS